MYNILVENSLYWIDFARLAFTALSLPQVDSSLKS